MARSTRLAVVACEVAAEEFIGTCALIEADEAAAEPEPDPEAEPAAPAKRKSLHRRQPPREEAKTGPGIVDPFAD